MAVKLVYLLCLRLTAYCDTELKSTQNYPVPIITIQAIWHQTFRGYYGKRKKNKN